MKKYKIVIDTNVILAGLRSRNGAAFKLLELLDSEKFYLNISVPLILEYESIISRNIDKLAIDEKDMTDFLDYICLIGKKCSIYYLWRPYLKDPKDEFVLELAFNSESDFIITYNKKDFIGIEKLGINVLTPKDFLQLIRK